MISPVQSHDRKGSPGVEKVLEWEGFVEKVGFETGNRSRADCTNVA